MNMKRAATKKLIKGYYKKNWILRDSTEEVSKIPMTLTNEQIKANENFFEYIIKNTKSYTWLDHGAVYVIEDDRFLCDTPAKAKLFQNHVSENWKKNHLLIL